MKPLEEPMDAHQPITSPELHGPYLNAPVWPWYVAGWIASGLLAVWFVAASMVG
jgi:hypothetical protein